MVKTDAQKLHCAERELIRHHNRTRKDDTRQKIVVGAAVISYALKNPDAARFVIDALNATPPRKHDKKVLEPLIASLKSLNNEVA